MLPAELLARCKQRVSKDFCNDIYSRSAFKLRRLDTRQIVGTSAGLHTSVGLTGSTLSNDFDLDDLLDCAMHIPDPVDLQSADSVNE